MARKSSNTIQSVRYTNRTVTVAGLGGGTTYNYYKLDDLTDDVSSSDIITALSDTSQNGLGWYDDSNESFLLLRNPNVDIDSTPPYVPETTQAAADEAAAQAAAMGQGGVFIPLSTGGAPGGPGGIYVRPDYAANTSTVSGNSGVWEGLLDWFRQNTGN